jgi:hypothetical protein
VKDLSDVNRESSLVAAWISAGVAVLSIVVFSLDVADGGLDPSAAASGYVFVLSLLTALLYFNVLDRRTCLTIAVAGGVLALVGLVIS